MVCEAAAVRTVLARLKRASERMLEEQFEEKLGVAFV